MNEAGTGREPAPEAGSNASRGKSRFLQGFAQQLRALSGIRLALLGAGVAAGILMIVTELSTIYAIDVVTATCEDLAVPRLADRCSASGGEQHSYAFLLLGAFAVPMSWGAVVGGSRPAAIALLATGIVVLLIAILGDLPDTTREGELGTQFSEAEAKARAGFWLELVAGALAVLAGTFSLTRRREVPAGGAPPG